MMSGKRDLLATLRSKSIDIGSFHGRSRDDEFGSNNNLKSGGVSWIEMSQTTLKGLMQMPSQKVNWQQLVFLSFKLFALFKQDRY